MKNREDKLVIEQPTWPIEISAELQRIIKKWAEHDSLWTTQETVEFNLTTFTRTIIGAITSSTAPLEQRIKELEKENMDHAEDWAFCGLDTKSKTVEGLVLRDKNRKLEQRIKELEHYLEASKDVLSVIAGTNSELRKQLATQQKALEFYGDEKNYDLTLLMDNRLQSLVQIDRGSIARAAMGKEK
jgi:hypothetical protein